ncbi:MAG: glycerophosphoryl diester phosphodiesterase membrane domain-containing protein [Mucilaginibacter sp.]
MKAKVELRQPRDFGEIISDCILFIRQNWKGLLKTYFVFCGFFMAGMLTFSFLQQENQIHYHSAVVNNGFTSSYSIFGIDYWLVLLFSFFNIISGILSVLCYIEIYNQKGKETPTLSEVWNFYKYYFWRIVGHTLLLVLIYIIGLVIIIIPAILIFRFASSFVSGLIVLVLVLVPVCYFGTIFSLFFPIVISENSGFGHAFNKCFKLVRRRWWNTFGVVLVSVIIVYAIFLLITIPFSILSGSMLTFLPYNVSIVTVILYIVLLSVFQLMQILPLTSAAVTYFSYAEEKENIGLLERIEALGENNIESVGPENGTY